MQESLVKEKKWLTTKKFPQKLETKIERKPNKKSNLR